MKWIIRLLAAIALVLVAAAVFALVGARRTEHPVGFRVATVGTARGPIAVALWYPTTAIPRPTTFVGGTLISVAADGAVRGRGLPVVVISHGNGASATSHVDLAMALASAGFVVAAPTHSGDNFADSARQGSATLFNARADELRATLDYVLARWPGATHTDPTRVGAFGMSAGGFTVLTLLGGRPDMARIAGQCQRAPASA